MIITKNGKSYIIEIGFHSAYVAPLEQDGGVCNAVYLD